MADLREWIRSRMKKRHADSISAWLLSLGTDVPATPDRRQLAFFRRILDEYGPPRPAVADSTESGDPAEIASEATEAPEEPPAAPSEGPAAQSAGRFHRA